MMILPLITWGPQQNIRYGGYRGPASIFFATLFFSQIALFKIKIGRGRGFKFIFILISSIVDGKERISAILLRSSAVANDW